MIDYYKTFVCISISIITWNTFKILKHQNNSKFPPKIDNIKEPIDSEELNSKLEKIKELISEKEGINNIQELTKSLEDISNKIDELKEIMSDSYCIIEN
ncbi:hypothetical protein CPAV1605_1420 [seawater metagenome]|uniref:Uncharacterized protein n=1 Tax=seawater metagenome TaxID=1561972 RepID=A0A5E8CKE0_9ZZZZ